VSRSVLNALGVKPQAGERILLTTDPLDMAIVCIEASSLCDPSLDAL